MTATATKDPQRAIGRSPDRLSLDEHRALTGKYIALEIYTPEDLPLRRIEAIAIADFKPEMTFVLDLPAEQGLERADARASVETRFEQFDIGFHERLRQAFLDIARRAPDRCIVIDASQDEKAVARAIWAAVASRFGLS